MCGGFSAATARASCSNRALNCSCVILIATARPRRVSRALKTWPMPPAPAALQSGRDQAVSRWPRASRWHHQAGSPPSPGPAASSSRRPPEPAATPLPGGVPHLPRRPRLGKPSAHAAVVGERRGRVPRAAEGAREFCVQSDRADLFANADRCLRRERTVVVQKALATLPRWTNRGTRRLPLEPGVTRPLRAARGRPVPAARFARKEAGPAPPDTAPPAVPNARASWRQLSSKGLAARARETNAAYDTAARFLPRLRGPPVPVETV